MIQIKPGHEVHNQFFLTTGMQIVGRLLNDGQPMAQQKLAVSQLPSRYAALFKTLAVTTDDNGRFEFANLPSNQTFVIFSPGAPADHPFVVPTRRFSSGNNDETRDLGDLNAMPGSRLTGKIVLPEGQNLPAHSRLILERDAAFDSIANRNRRRRAIRVRQDCPRNPTNSGFPPTAGNLIPGKWRCNRPAIDTTTPISLQCFWGSRGRTYKSRFAP